jgi:hypothetical protein
LPGLIAYARGGKDIRFNQPSATGGYGEYKRASLHTISAGFRVPYELLTGDLSKAWLGAAVLGLFIAILVGIFGIFQLQDIDYSLTLVTDNQILRQSLNNSRTIYVVLIFVAIVFVCGVFMYFYSKRDQLGVWSKLRSLRTKNDAESEIREYLHKLERNPKANSIVTWLRNIIR